MHVCIVNRPAGPGTAADSDYRAAAHRRSDYSDNLDKLVVYVDDRDDAESLDNDVAKTCGFVSRLNGALFKPRLHVQCTRRMHGRYVYIKAWGVANRWTRLYTAVLCEVMIYQ